MAKRAKRPTKIDLSASAADPSRDGPSGMGALGALLSAQGLTGSGIADAPEAETEVARSWTWAQVRRVVLHHERKGRGGKTVTIVHGVPAEGQETVRHQLQRQLGVGVRVEADALVIQGDQRERLRVWFAALGVARVIG